MSTSVYYKGAKLTDVANNTKTLLTAGKYLEGDVTLTDNTLVPTGTSTITSNGIYNVTNYASASVSVPIPSGYIIPSGTLSISANGTKNVTQYASVNVNVPDNALVVTLTYKNEYDSASASYIDMWCPNKTCEECFDAVADGMELVVEVDKDSYYDLTGVSLYSATATIELDNYGGTVLYDVIIVLYDSDRSIWQHYMLPFSDELWLQTEGQYIMPYDTISITENGLYDVTNYSGASVNVAGGGGITADQIAMRTISGDISGNATYISSYAFAYCSALTTASFPSVTSIYGSAFMDCTALTTANFPSATSIGVSAFYSCSNLTTISFPNVTSIVTNAFAYCTALTTANFPSATTIGISAFYQCSNLTTVSFPSATIISSYAFAYCSALTTASFPNVISIGFSAFAYCSALTTASFQNATIISSHAFVYCSALTTASFANATIISHNAFFYCSNLTTVSFPSATSIGTSAFYLCSNLTTVSFPNVKTINGTAFVSCYRLLSFYLLGSSIPTLGTSAFYSTPIDGYTTSTGGVYGSIFVPSSLYDSYITATNWSLYSSRIVSV